MTMLLKGKPIGDKIKDNIRYDVEKMKVENLVPKIGIVRVGNNPDDIYYENSIIKNADGLGIQSLRVELGQETSTEELAGELTRMNEDDSISGILLLRPLPKHIDYEYIKNVVSDKKDIDCMNPINLARVFDGKVDGFVPCTSKSALEILKGYDFDLEGKNIVIINRTMVVGKPLSMMLLNENATVTICHSKTKDLKSYTSKADIVVTALGKAKFLDRTYFNEDSIIVDVGMGVDETGKISGDVDFESVDGYVKAITPVPGGVGGLTTTILLENVVKGAK